MKTLAFAATFALAGAALAQEVAPKIEILMPAAEPKVGQPLTVTVRITFAPGLHGYQNPPLDPFQNPVAVEVFGPDFGLASVRYPKGFEKEAAGGKALVYEGVIDIPIVVRPLRAGARTLGVRVKYQQCTDTTCFPPTQADLRRAVKVVK